MAGPVMCDSEDGELAVMLISNLQDGETVALCAVCAPPWFISMADAFNRAVAQEAARLEEPAQEPAQEGEAAPDPPSPKSGRTRRQATEADLTAEASPFQEVATDQ